MSTERHVRGCICKHALFCVISAENDEQFLISERRSEPNTSMLFFLFAASVRYL
jgi:hypothetical protein